MVIIGHSKGGAEILLMALAESDFIRKNVAAVITIQGAIGGSLVADALANNQAAGDFLNSCGVGLKKFMWQKSFYDHIIRSETELLHIQKYIRYNPLKWGEDEYYNPNDSE
jgi:hypothetical protein